MIQAKNVAQTVFLEDSPIEILKDIHLEIQAGESVAIVGASGSGKSTLLGLLAGLDVPSGGQILIDGHDITALDEEQRANIRSRYVAFIFQNFQLLPSYSALDNVMLPLHLKGIQNPASHAHEYLSQVGLAPRAQHLPSQLSGGEQQRVAIARAFACQSPILFADEPTGNLDSKTGAQIVELLFKLNQENRTTLVLVTHDPSLARQCASQMTLQQGKLSSNEAAL